MTPSKPLMALGAAILMAAPSVVRADDSADYKLIRTKSQNYYVGKSDFGEYEKMEKHPKGLQKAGPITLLVDEKAEGQPVQKKASGATLSCALNTSHKTVKQGDKKITKSVTTWDCAIKVNAGTNGAYEITVKPGDTQPEIATTVQQAAAERPADVSQEVWAEVVSGKHKPAIPEAKWAQAARDVQKVVDSPQGQKMLAAGNHDMNVVMNAVALELSKGADDATIVKKAIDLAEPLKVARAPKTGGTTPAPGTQQTSTDGAGGGQGDGRPQVVDGNNVLNTLAQLLSQPEVQADFAKRLYAFVGEQKGDDSYLAIDGHPDALKALEQGLGEEVKKLCADDPGRGKAAVLYFMLGDTQKPWFQNHGELMALTQEQQMRGYFKEYMKPWTKAGSGVPSVTNAGRYTGDAKWPPAFVASALLNADKTWKDRRVKGQIRLRVDQNDQGLAVMGDVRRGGGLGSEMNNQAQINFDESSTWENGAVIKMVEIPGKPGQYRKLAMKVVAQQTAWGPPPVTEDRVMVYDVTDKSPDGGQTPSSFFGRYFAIANNYNNKSFPMDKTNPQSINYSFAMSGGQLTLTALNAKGKPGSEPFAVSMSDLYKARETELNDKRQSYVAEINGQRYRVIPQPGRYTGLAYFPADDSGRITENKPAMMVDLAQWGKPLLTNGVPSDRPVGYIGKDESGNPQFWYMHYNADTKTYEYKKGDAPKDPPYDPMAKVATPAVAGGASAATPTAGGAGSSTDQTAGGSPGSPAPTGNPDDPTASTAKISDCTSDWSKNFLASQFKDELYRKDGPWQLYSNGKADPGQVNTTWMCVYKNMGIYFEGLIPKGAISINGDEKTGTLKVTSVKQGPPDPDGPDKGQILIRPNEADNLTIKDGQIVYGKNKSRPIASSTDYIFKLSTLKKNLMTYNAHLGATTKLDWVEQTRDYNQGNQNPSFIVSIGKGDDAKALFMEAVKLYGGDNTLCKNGSEVSDVIAKYIDSAVSDPAFKQAIDKIDMGGISATRPSIEFKCLAQGTQTEGVWNLASPSWVLDSSRILLVRNGKVDTSSGYASK